MSLQSILQRWRPGAHPRSNAEPTRVKAQNWNGGRLYKIKPALDPAQEVAIQCSLARVPGLSSILMIQLEDATETALLLACQAGDRMKLVDGLVRRAVNDAVPGQAELVPQ